MTAAAATIYFVFLVYFDWLGSTTHLPPLRRNLWVAMHLPFHLALVLFMQGFTQLLIWGKIATQLRRAFDFADPTDDLSIVNANSTSLAVSSSVNGSVQSFFHDYPAKLQSTAEVVNGALTNISSLPNTFWPALTQLVNGDGAGAVNFTDDQIANYETLLESGTNLAISMANAVFSAFGIEVAGEIEAKNTGTEKQDGRGFQFEVQTKNWDRYGLVVSILNRRTHGETTNTVCSLRIHTLVQHVH